LFRNNGTNRGVVISTRTRRHAVDENVNTCKHRWKELISKEHWQ